MAEPNLCHGSESQCGNPHNWNRGATHNEHSTDEGRSPETSEHLLRFWHFHHQHSKRLFIVVTSATQPKKSFLTSYIILIVLPVLSSSVLIFS